MAVVGFQEIGWKRARPPVAWTLDWYTVISIVFLWAKLVTSWAGYTGGEIDSIA